MMCVTAAGNRQSRKKGQNKMLMDKDIMVEKEDE